MNKEDAKRHIQETCGSGWINLIEIVFDNKPENIEITEVFQKWAGLKVKFNGESEQFQYMLDCIYEVSQKMCEICGKSGHYVIIDGWETSLCHQHYEESNANEKHRMSAKFEWW